MRLGCASCADFQPTWGPSWARVSWYLFDCFLVGGCFIRVCFVSRPTCHWFDSPYRAASWPTGTKFPPKFYALSAFRAALRGQMGLCFPTWTRHYNLPAALRPQGTMFPERMTLDAWSATGPPLEHVGLGGISCVPVWIVVCIC